MSAHRNKSSSLMDAIAHGVQARLDERICFSQRVAEETIDTARALGVPGAIIEKWATGRLNQLTQETKRLQAIKSLLEGC